MSVITLASGEQVRLVGAPILAGDAEHLYRHDTIPFGCDLVIDHPCGEWRLINVLERLTSTAVRLLAFNAETKLSETQVSPWHLLHWIEWE